MITITEEELQKLAKLSAFTLEEDEKSRFTLQLQELLSYTSELEKVSDKAAAQLPRQNINVFRDDRPVPCEASAILEAAPATEETFFVVPKIL